MKLPPGTRISSLSFHADYRCAHSGACCTSGWPIPVERDTFERLQDCVRRGALSVEGEPDAAEPFVPVSGAPADSPVTTAVRDEGSCVFYERASGLCAIHRQAGAALLPVACRQFPRVSLLDDRGLFVSVSHYCPTAAGELFRSDIPLRVVEGPCAFPAEFPFDPLDARAAVPPLLRPGVLMDLATFDRWERAAIEVFAGEGKSAEDAVAEVSRLTEALRNWAPGDGPLASHLDAVLDASRLCGRSSERPSDVPPTIPSRPLPRDHYNLVLDAIPRDLRPSVALDAVDPACRRWVEGRWRDFARVVRRYLAAKLFGSWLAYQGRGLRTIVYSLEVAISVLEANAALECRARSRALGREEMTAAIRRTDELLLHLASRQDLANRLSASELLTYP